jgi:hypothetical protein
MYRASPTAFCIRRTLPRMAASVLMVEALALGLASGPACVASCGPVLVPALLTSDGGVRPNARLLGTFLGARLLGYMIFAVAAWQVGRLAAPGPGPRLMLTGAVDVTLAGVLFWYAFTTKHACGASCSTNEKLVTISAGKDRRMHGAAVMGLLTGLSLCPPFVAAGFRAAQLGSAMLALLFFACFFVGTTMWFAPFAGLGCVVRNQAVATVARMTMALIALYYLILGIAMLIGRHGYGY